MQAPVHWFYCSSDYVKKTRHECAVCFVPKQLKNLFEFLKRKELFSVYQSELPLSQFRVIITGFWLCKVGFRVSLVCLRVKSTTVELTIFFLSHGFLYFPFLVCFEEAQRLVMGLLGSLPGQMLAQQCLGLVAVALCVVLILNLQTLVHRWAGLVQ